MEKLIVRRVERNTIKQENGVIHPAGFGAMLCTAGRGTVTYGERVYMLEPGVLTLFMSYSTIHIEQEFEELSGMLFEADTETTLQLLLDIPMEQRLAIVQHPCVKIVDGDERLVRQLFDMMIEQEQLMNTSSPNDVSAADLRGGGLQAAEQSSGSSLQAADAKTWGNRILQHLAYASCFEILRIYSHANQLVGAPVTRQSAVYNRFIESVSTGCSSQRTVAHYAAEQHLSVGHFSTIVRTVSGHAPMYWIELFTMTAIKKLLRSSSLSVKEIAERMSFPDQSTMGRYFKEREGVSPAAYRK